MSLNIHGNERTKKTVGERLELVFSLVAVLTVLGGGFSCFVLFSGESGAGIWTFRFIELGTLAAIGIALARILGVLTEKKP